jgi:dynein heavy chain, axonemal
MCLALPCWVLFTSAVTGIEEEIDPLLDPVLEKQFVKKGKRSFVTVSDKQLEVNDAFQSA